jgi:hypothetical protein
MKNKKSERKIGNPELTKVLASQQFNKWII